MGTTYFILGDRVRRFWKQGEFVIIGLSDDCVWATISSDPLSHACSATHTHPTAELELVRRGEFAESNGYIVEVKKMNAESDVDRFFHLVTYMDPTFSWPRPYDPMVYIIPGHPPVRVPTTRKALLSFREHAMKNAAGCLDSGLLG